jgi:hypothetical protein
VPLSAARLRSAAIAAARLCAPLREGRITAVAGVHEPVAEPAEGGVTGHHEQRPVEEGVVLAELLRLFFISR